MGAKLPKPGKKLTVRIREILERHECPPDRIDALTEELRAMACVWRDQRGSSGRRQGRQRMPEYLIR